MARPYEFNYEGINRMKKDPYIWLYWLAGFLVYTQSLLWLFDYLAGL